MNFVQTCEKCGRHFEDEQTAYEIHMLRHLLEDIHGLSAKGESKGGEAKPV